MKIAILSASARPDRKSHRAALALTEKLNSKQGFEPILVDRMDIFMFLFRKSS
jgi:NAD(P)H-dependent FMN reductase